MQSFDRMKESCCTRYTQPMLRHVPAVCLQKTVIVTYLEMSELEISSQQSSLIISIMPNAGNWTLFHSQNQDADQMVIWLLQLHIMSAGRLL